MGIQLSAIKAKLIGNRFGKLTIESYNGRSHRGDNLWRCRCDCGEIVVGRTENVTQDNSACTSCKRQAAPAAVERTKALLGKRFGRLVVKEYVGKTAGDANLWLCKCDCGKEVSVRTGSLNSGVTKSCGCYAKAVASTPKLHGLSKHPLYAVWAAMKDRCSNPNNELFHRYGGRGIVVCDEWRDSFVTFYGWAMSSGYRPGITLDRRDNDGDYDPDNCRWRTYSEQMQNTSRTKISPEQIAMIKTDPRTNRAVALELGVNESTISRIRGGRTWSNIQTNP